MGDLNLLKGIVAPGAIIWFFALLSIVLESLFPPLGCDASVASSAPLDFVHGPPCYFRDAGSNRRWGGGGGGSEPKDFSVFGGGDLTSPSADKIYNQLEGIPKT